MEGRPPYLAPDLWSLFPDRLDADGKPEGWVSATLGEVAVSEARGCSPDEITAGTPYIALEHMPRRQIALGEWATADNVESGKLRFHRGEFLFGKLRPYFHKVGIAAVDGVCTTDAVVIRPTEHALSAFVLMTISSAEFVDFTDRGSTGTKMPRTSWSQMQRYPLTMPKSRAAEALEALAGPMLNKIIENVHEARTLAATRDLLLPRLMSGALRVKDAEHAVETNA
jgi:type I restriction enzyme S subunit